MQGDRIEVGAIIELRGQQHSISEELPDGRLRLESLDGNSSTMAVPRTQLERAYIDGMLKFPVAAWVKDLTKESAGPKLPQDVTQLPEPIQKETHRRSEYVKAVIKVPDQRWDQRTLGTVLADVSARLDDSGPPSISTVRRWYRRYIEAEKDIRALIPRTQWRGSRRRRLHPLVLKIIEAMIERYYLNRVRNTVAEVYQYIVEEVRRANTQRGPEPPLAAPSLRLVYNQVAKLDPYHVCERRYGRAYAKRQFAQTGKGIAATRPLERVEIDHSKADLMVIDDETRLPIGRPWISVLIDKYTRMVFGIHIGFTPPSFLSVMHALRHGILPKADLRERYPIIENDWPIYGKPETVVCDNGPEFRSTSFAQTLADIGIDLELNDPGQPHQKGTVERFLGRINRDLLQSQPGTTFSNILDRSDYDPAENAVVPLSSLKLMIFRFICDFYHLDYHEGLGGQPLAVYRDALEKYPPPTLPRSVEELTPLLCKVDEKKIHHYGVEILGLKYNHSELASIRHRVGRQKVKIRINEEDLTAIYVWDDFEQRYITVPCTTPDYADGLTLWQHKVIRRNAINKGKRGVDTAALARVRREIQEMVEACWKKPSRTGHKQKAARWLNVGNDIETGALSAVLDDRRQEEPTPSMPTINESALMAELMRDGWGTQPHTDR